VKRVQATQEPDRSLRSGWQARRKGCGWKGATGGEN